MTPGAFIIHIRAAYSSIIIAYLHYIVNFVLLGYTHLGAVLNPDSFAFFFDDFEVVVGGVQ